MDNVNTWAPSVGDIAEVLPPSQPLTHRLAPGSLAIIRAEAMLYGTKIYYCQGFGEGHPLNQWVAESDLLKITTKGV
jgi:hypothetical protein